MLLSLLGDQAAFSGTRNNLLLGEVLSFQRTRQTVDEVGRAHALLMSQFTGGCVDVSPGTTAALGKAVSGL